MSDNKKELLSLISEYENILDSAKVIPSDDPGYSFPEVRCPKGGITKPLKENIDKIRNLVVASSEKDIRNIVGVVLQLNDQLKKFRNTPSNDPWDESDRLISLQKESAILLRSFVSSLCGNEQGSEFEFLEYVFPQEYFESDVTEIINLSYQEVLTGYQHECYISAISTCGKVIETVIGSLYHHVTGGDADAEKLGFDAVINRLRESGYDFKNSVLHQMKIIGEHRNKAVHGSIRTPTRDEARGVISFTKDVLLKAGSRELPES